MTLKEEFTQKIQAISDEAQEEYKKLQAGVEKLDDHLTEEYHEVVEKLKTKREEAKVKFQDFKEDSGEAWEELKEGLELSWTDFRDAVTAAREKFQDSADQDAD